MSIIVLSSYPLTKEFKGRLSEILETTPEYQELAKLRQMPVMAILRELWNMRGPQLVVPLEDPTSASILPIMRLLASLTRARRLSVLHYDLKIEPISRFKTLLAMLPFLWASLSCIYNVRKATHEADKLSNVERESFVEQPNQPIIYLNANLWFGVQAGGSVGHISGVVNGFLDSGADLVFCSAGGHLMVDENRYIVRYRYESWVDYVSREVPPRIDLKPFADFLQTFEGNPGYWEADDIASIVPVMRFRDEDDDMAPSSITSGLFVNLLAQFLGDNAENESLLWSPATAQMES